jgi:hypothetical protein
VSGATFFRDEVGALSSFWRSASIVAIFLLVWPPVCGGVGWWMKFDFGPPFLGWIVAVAIYSYFFLAPAALLAGLIHAIAAITFHHNSIWVPVPAAGSATILSEVLIGVVPPGPMHHLSNTPLETHVILFVASLIASLICWRLARRFSRTA